MFRLVVLGLLGTFLPLTLAYPAKNAAVTAPAPVPTKYAACKTNDCPPFRVVQKFADDIELREYSRVFWASAKAQAPRINKNVTTPLYWRLRGYVRKSNNQLQKLKSKYCSNVGGSPNKNLHLCQKKELEAGVPVTRLIETTKTGMKSVTMSLYLSSTSPPHPSDSNVWLEHKSLLVYVKIFKGLPFFTMLGEGYAHVLANDLIRLGVDGTAFYAPSTKFMTAGYDGPFVLRQKRTNEVWLIKRPSSTK